MNEETEKELLWAIRNLIDAINNYAAIKQRGIKLAERIEDDKASKVYLYQD